MSEIEFGNPIHVDYKKKYKEALVKLKEHFTPTSDGIVPDNISREQIEDIFPEHVESEDELTWLTRYIEEEAYNLSMDIRDNEDRIKLKKLQKSLAWLEKQGKLKWTEEDEDNLNMAIYFMRSENTSYSPTDVEPVIEWLCGLKQRMEE